MAVRELIARIYLPFADLRGTYSQCNLFLLNIASYKLNSKHGISEFDVTSCVPEVVRRTIRMALAESTLNRYRRTCVAYVKCG